MDKSIEGIVLKAIDYGEYDQILTVFTKDLGILPFFFKRNKSSLKSAKISPLVVAEFTYTTTKGALLKCKDIHPINSHFNLRAQYVFLETAGKLIQKLFLSQTEYRQAPNLYDLLLFYLKLIPTFPELKTIESSFIIKIIKNEGLLQTDLHCHHCKKILNDFYIADSGYYCREHYLTGAIYFNQEDVLLYFQLAACKNLKELASYIPSKEFFDKLEALFNSYFFLH